MGKRRQANERAHSSAPRPVQQGSRRSVSIATPKAGRGTDCPRRGVPSVLRAGSSPKAETRLPELGICRGSASGANRARPGGRAQRRAIIFMHMREMPPHLRTIQGGKKDLKDRETHRAEPTAWDRNIAKVRGRSPALDAYLTKRPMDRIARLEAILGVWQSLRQLVQHDVGLELTGRLRVEQKFGERPRPKEAFWSDATEEQVAWDEKYVFEIANAIAEKMTAIEQQAKKLGGLEDHLTTEAAKAYGDGEESKS